MDGTALTSLTDDLAGPGLEKTRPAEDGTGADIGEQWDLVVYVTDTLAM